MTIPILYCLALGSAITDIWKNKIFNGWLLVGCMAKLLMFLTNGCMQEMPHMVVAKACFTILILLPIYFLRGIGGGDIKLLAVISMFLSLGELISLVIIAFYIGAAFGIIKLATKRKFPSTIHFAVPILISVLLVTGGGGLICS